MCFVPQVATVARAGPGPSQELGAPSCSHRTDGGPKYFDHPLLPSQVQCQKAASRVKQLTLQLALCSHHKLGFNLLKHLATLPLTFRNSAT